MNRVHIAKKVFAALARHLGTSEIEVFTQYLGTGLDFYLGKRPSQS